MGNFSHKIVKTFCGIDLDQLNNELDKLKQEKHSLENSVSEEKEKFTALQKEYDKLVSGKAELETECSVSKANISEIESKLDCLNKEKNNLDDENKRLSESIKTYTLKQTELLSNIEKANADSKVYKEKNEALQSEINVLKKNLSGIGSEKENLQNELVILKKEKESLELLHNELKADNSRLASMHNSEQAEKDAVINSLRKEIEDCKSRIEAFETEAKEQTLLLEKANNEKETALEEVKKFSCELNNLKELYEKEKAKYEEALADANKKLTEKCLKGTEEKLQKPIASSGKPHGSSTSTKEKTNTTESNPKETQREEKEKLNNELVSIRKKFDYVRVTTNIGTQYIYQSKHLQLKAGLFDWGIEGKEIITDETLYLKSDCIAKTEGLDTPFDSEKLICDLNNEESAQQLVETLLTAICTYQPVQINYHDKNGRTTIKNLYHISFQPTVSKFTLPYKDMFKDMLEENIDTDHISAICPHNAEPRNFSIAQIDTIQRFNAFFTTAEGIKTMKEGVELAKKADQQELAEILSSRLPL